MQQQAVLRRFNYSCQITSLRCGAERTGASPTACTPASSPAAYCLASSFVCTNYRRSVSQMWCFSGDRRITKLSSSFAGVPASVAVLCSAPGACCHDDDGDKEDDKVLVIQAATVCTRCVQRHTACKQRLRVRDQ